ncbi:MAG: hypothetical protein A2W99_17285 [Bacteroidetes bacterium GWF2_33_16]|nr:MAG: hypothetical protein A2X00_13510 [Bacteroidetes bacterium GWE2_32_14]OFY03501.1 MAG: hypothetical protein A2W99_17285 [Bacteroidetes bacterium GWF2_33_16]
MKQVIYDYDYAQILYEPSVKLGIVVWKHKPENAEYQNAFEVMIEYSKKHPVENFLSDIRNQGVVSPDNRKWFETVMIPKAIKNGLKRAAVIFDGNVFKKYYINMIIQVINKYGIPMKLFNTEEDAIIWFKSFNK